MGEKNWGSLLLHARNSSLHMSPHKLSNNVPGDEERLIRRGGEREIKPL